MLHAMPRRTKFTLSASALNPAIRIRVMMMTMTMMTVQPMLLLMLLPL
jgi:hypothetical protein